MLRQAAPFRSAGFQPAVFGSASSNAKSRPNFFLQDLADTPPPLIFRKYVIPKGLRVGVCKECESKGVKLAGTSVAPDSKRLTERKTRPAARKSSAASRNSCRVPRVSLFETRVLPLAFSRTSPQGYATSSWRKLRREGGRVTEAIALGWPTLRGLAKSRPLFSDPRTTRNNSGAELLAQPMPRQRLRRSRQKRCFLVPSRDARRSIPLIAIQPQISTVPCKCLY